MKLYLPQITPSVTLESLSNTISPSSGIIDTTTFTMNITGLVDDHSYWIELHDSNMTHVWSVFELAHYVTGATIKANLSGTFISTLQDLGYTNTFITPGTYVIGISDATEPNSAWSNTITLTTSSQWKSNYVFPVGGLAISSAEGNTNQINCVNNAYDNYKTTNWNTNSNLVRLPIVWGFGSTGNDNYALFTSKDFPSEYGSWAYDHAYYNAINTIITNLVNSNKIVILDLHTYCKWNNTQLITTYPPNAFLTEDANKLALIWAHILNVFEIESGDNNILKNPLVWFELSNEPSLVDNFAYFQQTINQIRGINNPYTINNSYTNKIIIAIDVYNPGGHIVDYTNPVYDDCFILYNKSFPTDTNLCVTIHQYFDQNGSGSAYDAMCDPWFTQETRTGYNLSETITIISEMCKTNNCDIILGEFGYTDTNSNTAGQTAINNLLSALEDCNTTNNYTSNTVTDFLTKTTGGLWLGFAAWQYSGSQGTVGYFTENYITDSMYTNVYQKYFNKS